LSQLFLWSLYLTIFHRYNRPIFNIPSTPKQLHVITKDKGKHCKSSQNLTTILYIVVATVGFCINDNTKYISIQQKWNSENHQNWWFSEFHPVFHFSWARLHCCCYIDFHCSYLYNYYNSSRPLCIKCWDSAFRTKFQHFILRFNKISLLYGYH
jgi:hypothetical protein